MKVVINLGYKDYVLDAADAVTVLQLLENAELYQEKWQPMDQGGTLYYVYPQTPEASTLKVLTDSLYEMAKLAGKPEK